jgi:hypothetical protein
LVAGELPQPLSLRARLVLIGQDHRAPGDAIARGFGANRAIQRTEVLEYAIAQGNAQFELAGLQPFKLIYAMRLAEMGLVHEALGYCNAIVRAVKAAGDSSSAGGRGGGGGGAAAVYTRGFLERLQTFHERLAAHDPGPRAFSAGDQAGEQQGSKWWGKVVGGLERTITAIVASAEDEEVWVLPVARLGAVGLVYDVSSALFPWLAGRGQGAINTDCRPFPRPRPRPRPCAAPVHERGGASSVCARFDPEGWCRARSANGHCCPQNVGLHAAPPSGPAEFHRNGPSLGGVQCLGQIPAAY